VCTVASEQFGTYRLDELIGRGGMGEVYRAYDTTKKRTVALKRLPPHLAGDGEFQTRFRREAEVAARLNEPHIVPIHDYGEIAGQLFIDMRLVVGTDLAGLIEQNGPLPPARAVAIITQIASALAAAHAEGLTHRDVKPANVLITATGRGEDFVHLVDFGIARTDGATVLTATGSAMGTIDYMAPEQLVQGHCDHRVDIYALGCVLFEALTATKPFPAAGLPGKMYAHVHTDPPVLSQHRPNLPAGLDDVITRAMAKNPEHRYRSTPELADHAHKSLAGRPSAAPRPPRPGATLPLSTPTSWAPIPQHTRRPVPPTVVPDRWPSQPRAPHRATGPAPAPRARAPEPAGPAQPADGPATNIPASGPDSSPGTATKVVLGLLLLAVLVLIVVFAVRAVLAVS
jgi:serine/threonine-protein kinase